VYYAIIVKEILDSIIDHYKARLSSPVYGIFAFWWITLHWEFFYTLLFVDQEAILQKTGLLKNEYLTREFYSYQYIDFWIEFFIKVLISLILTALMIWVLPRKVILPVYSRIQEDRAQKLEPQYAYQEKREEIRLRLERKKAAIKTEEANQAEQAAKVVAKEVEIKKSDPTLQWGEEYKEFKKIPLFSYFREIIESLYEHNGYVDVPQKFRLDRDILAYADANELVDYDADEGTISIKPKGRYFVARYQTESS
jgi:hypothetical protein